MGVGGAVWGEFAADDVVGFGVEGEEGLEEFSKKGGWSCFCDGELVLIFNFVGA